MLFLLNHLKESFKYHDTSPLTTVLHVLRMRTFSYVSASLCRKKLAPICNLLQFSDKEHSEGQVRC